MVASTRPPSGGHPPSNDLYALSLHTKIPILDLEILLCHVLKIDRSFLKSHPENTISTEQTIEFHNLATRRANHEPIAYIIGNKNFWDLNLLITKDVLIPRSETEILVEQALEKLPRDSQATILELGTGSGAIALAIAKHRPNTIVTATDISMAALDVARVNAKNLNINNVNFLYGNWFENFTSLNCKFNLIISNPPYIALNEINLCSQEIFYEPKLALFTSNNGLKCLEQIIFASNDYLTANGYILLEHGVNQASQIISLLRTAKFSDLESFKDLSGLDRVVVAKKL